MAIPTELPGPQLNNIPTYNLRIVDVKRYVLLTVHLVIIFVNNQFDAQFFFMYVYFYSLYVSDSHVSIIRRINCINTTSGIMYLCVDDRLVYQTVVYTEGHIPDVVLIQLILLMMDTWLSETYRE